MKSASVRALSLPWTDVDCIITSHHSSPFISVVTQSIHHVCSKLKLSNGDPKLKKIPMCTLKAKVVVLKRQLLELLRALRRIPLHRRLRSSSNSADQVLRLLLLRKDECTLAGQAMKKKCCWGYGPKIIGLLKCHHWHIFSPSATLIVQTKSLLSGCGFKFSVAFFWKLFPSATHTFNF